ncbi:rhamnan synthesis F family protein [Sphingomonas solaris]|uniref:Glycosyltransferase n=1 Tax=Alterirhizorhabdus solaris TaxID=2529389 RepID=A0A558QX64_9SPHN|nr:rhamnan synthesis F family protein [Sphingomonas solaris]TVV71698.1 glycosyltransferase [Sphingomonas solaris]
MSEIIKSAPLIAPDHLASEADVENGYRLFLAREPEAPTIVTNLAGHPLLLVLTPLLVSDEAQSKLGLVDGELAVSEIMLEPLDPDLRDWVNAITRPGSVDDGTPVDRLTVIRRFLGDSLIRHTADALDPCHGRDIDALNAALAGMDDSVRLIGTSPFFDPLYYEDQRPAGMSLADPATHYVLHGERQGLKASTDFDAAAYAGFNPDVAASSLNRLMHYELCGRREQRRHRHWLADHPMPPIAATADAAGRPTILLLLHEASYTGAPILGWNLVQALSDRCNVVVVLRNGGALEGALREVASAFVAAPPPETTVDPHEMRRFAERLVEIYRPLYAIANSVESRPIAVALRQFDIPVVALVHEFWPGAASHVRLEFYSSCAALVFPARIVAESSFHAFRETRLQKWFILPQGPSAIPPFDRSLAPLPFGAPFDTGDEVPVPLEALLADGRRGEGTFTVIGLGAVEMRKGLDLFIAAATAMRAKHTNMAFRFIWIGTWEHAIGTPYAALLDEQVRRAGLGDHLHFYPAVDNLEPVYARADALFLSSRLDPLPNVVIDAAFRGIPVVCFDQASGAAELLAADPDTASLVVPHLDSGAAADRLVALARDAADRRSCGEAVQRLARRSFDMKAYAETLDRIGCDAARDLGHTETDRRLIEDVDALDTSLYFQLDRAALSPAIDPAALYLDRTRHINFASPPVFGVILRRPRPGFHPFIYATEAPGFPRDGSRDPLAHYIEQGMPAGRWSHPVLRLDQRHRAGLAPHVVGPGIAPATPPVALHGHFHYTDDIAEFMQALAANCLRADLFLTTTTDESADILRAATRDYGGGRVVVDVGPNIGRDIYAFLRVLKAHVRGRYEFVGHVHGKRSLHMRALDPAFGDQWRQFLWEHLLGPTCRAADLIVDAMRRDKTLGLVFPENGFLVGWERNVASPAALARRIGMRGPLPDYIEFGAGTMFWARTAALDALIEANLGEHEIPAEPLPTDGTILHALERMLPLICAEAGYTYATTHIPAIAR